MVLGAITGVVYPQKARAERTLRTNDFAIDYHRGPVLGPGRAVGLGGAYGTLVSGVDGVTYNAAAWGLRSNNDLGGLGVDLLLSVSFPQRNWDNSGASGRDYDNFSIVQVGAGLQLGRFGGGALVISQGYTLGARNGFETAVNVNLFSMHTGFGVQLAHGEIGIGAGLRIGLLSLDWAATFGGQVGTTAARYVGVGPELGVVWRPLRKPFRLSVAYRSEVDARSTELGDHPGSSTRLPTGCDPGTTGCFVVPGRMVLPWELELSAAVMFGERVFNPGWQDPTSLRNELRESQERARVSREVSHRRALEAVSDPLERSAEETRWRDQERQRREREDQEYDSFAWRLRASRRAAQRDHGRRYVLVSASLVLSGPVGRGQGIDAFMEQTERPSGLSLIASPRLGVETEPLANRLQVRLGSYLEPSRFSDVAARMHVTGGIELRLFRWNFFKLVDPVDFKVTVTADYTSNYFDWNFGIGFWR